MRENLARNTGLLPPDPGPRLLLLFYQWLAPLAYP